MLQIAPATGGASREPLAAYPFFSSTDSEEVRTKVARVFCPHDLIQVSGQQRFASRHNLVRLGETALNYLTYGTAVDILPDCLQTFFLVQIPLSGHAEIECGRQRIQSSAALASVLSPDQPTRMRWSDDNRQVLLWIPRKALESRLAEQLGHALDAPLEFRLGLSTQDGLTRAWCRMLLDLVNNIDHSGADWLRFRPATAALEDCLLRGLLNLHQHNFSEALAEPAPAGGPRHLQRAIDYIHEHADETITVGDLARAACVSTRALEDAFRKHRDTTPQVYLREVRLDRVRKALLHAAGSQTSVTEIAYRNGFLHPGRFSAYYRERFGETPSQTLRRASQLM